MFVLVALYTVNCFVKLVYYKYNRELFGFSLLRQGLIDSPVWPGIYHMAQAGLELRTALLLQTS